MKPTGFIIGIVILGAVIGAIYAVISTDNFGDQGSGLSEEFQYDLAPLKQTNPDFILYEELDTKISTGLDWARFMVLSSDDNIHITGETSVHTFNSSGQKLASIIETNDEITGMTVAEDGSFYLAIGNHIEIYDPTGQLKNRWEPAAENAVLSSIGVYNEHVFVTDFRNKIVHHYDTSGNKRKTFGDFIVPSPYFDLAITTKGDLIIVNPGEHRLETYGFDGNLISWWGEFSMNDAKHFCGCCNPVSIALLPNDEGFVTCEKGLTRVKVYDEDGTFAGFVAGSEQFTAHDERCASPDHDFRRVGLDVAVDSKGRIVVFDPALAEVRFFKKKAS